LALVFDIVNCRDVNVYNRVYYRFQFFVKLVFIVNDKRIGPVLKVLVKKLDALYFTVYGNWDLFGIMDNVLKAIWLEIFILPDYNLSDEELIALKKTIIRIKPDSVQLNTLDRPGTVTNLHPASHNELQKIVDLWSLKNVEIIAKAPERKNMQSYRDDAATAILETITRRPCTIDDLMSILGMHINEINKYLDVLEAENKIETVRQERGVFYQKVDRLQE